MGSKKISNKRLKKQRGKEYGSASKSFGRIATLWEAYLGFPIKAHEVAMMMVLLKVSRSTTASGFHLDDSYQDAEIYLQFAKELHKEG